nr:SBBP repeat-containing protein [Bacteroidota bacterium]
MPNAIYVNPTGEVYVTGQSDSDPSPYTSNNIVTIKYATSGAQQWLNTYTGVGGKDDNGNAVIENSNGKCFVVGYTEESNEQRNGLVLRYEGAGTFLSEYILNGSGDNSDNVRDIAVDQNNNVYMVGYTISKLADRNFCVVKIDAAGDTVWIRQTDGSSPGSDDEAYSVMLDNAGNIIVGGFTKNTGTSSDWQVIKYNPNGDTLWTYLYDSPAHETDKSYAMQQDGIGNIYLTGRTDADPSINSDDNCLTIKLNANGIQQWVTSYTSAGNNNERGNIIRVASSGNIYVAGRTFNGTNEDILVLKYDNNGNQQWVHTFSNNNGDDIPSEMVIDANENIYITGQTASTIDTIFDFVTLKYDATGAQQWIKTYDGNGQNDFARGLALDNSGNVNVAGYSDIDASVDTNYNVVTIQYDASGNVKWMQSFDFGNNLNDIADALTTDSYGNIYVAAHSNKNSTSDPDYDMVILRYDSNGNINWSATANGNADSIDVPNLVMINGNDIYMAGSFTSINQQRDITVIKYSGYLAVENLSSLHQNILSYPNPCKDKVKFVSENNFINYTLEIFDNTGRLITTEKINNNAAINMSHIDAGFYTYKISNENNAISTGKLIHQ